MAVWSVMLIPHWFPHGELTRGAQLLLCVSLTALMAQLLSVELPDRTDSRRDVSAGRMFQVFWNILTWEKGWDGLNMNAWIHRKTYRNTSCKNFVFFHIFPRFKSPFEQHLLQPVWTRFSARSATVLVTTSSLPKPLGFPAAAKRCDVWMCRWARHAIQYENHGNHGNHGNGSQNSFLKYFQDVDR